MNRLAITTLLLLVLAAPSFAGETEDKFHAAYAKEVVEGDVKGAALDYLALMDDGSATDRLRAEAKFRFAVCAVLLGRADEARAHLTGLIEDEATPAEVRKKAEEYRTAVSGIGVGTELTKKLQSLVFDLGRVDPGVEVPVPVYRDFEIIGKPSLPFLRTLLHHTDANLRRHAYRLLCRMRDPGMAAAWSPSIGLSGKGFCRDVTDYLKASPAELAAFEKRIVEFGDEGYRQVASMSPWPNFSVRFVQVLAWTEKWRNTAFSFLSNAGKAAERNDVLIAWLEGENGEMSRRTASYLMSLGSSVPEAVASPARFRVFLNRVIELETDFQGSRSATWRQCLQRWLERVAPEAALAELERVMSYGESLEEPLFTNPVMAGLATELAGRVEKALPDGVDAAKYAGLLKRWLTVQRRIRESAAAAGYNPPPVPNRELAQRYAAFIHRAPLDDAKAFLTWILTGPAKGSASSSWVKSIVATPLPRDVDLYLTAMRGATPADRLQLAGLLIKAFRRKPPLSEERRTAWSKALLDLAPLCDASLANTLFGSYHYVSEALPREEAKKHLRAVFLLLPSMRPEARDEVVSSLIGARGYGNTEFLTDTVRSVIPEFWETLTEKERQGYLGILLNLISRTRSGNVVLGTGGEETIRFLRGHIAELTQTGVQSLARQPELFPPEEWIRYIHVAYPVHWHQVKQEERDRIAGKLAEKLVALNKAEVKFILGQASQDVRAEIFTRGLALDIPEVRSLFVFQVANGAPVPLDTVEKTLDRLVAEGPEDLSEVRHLAKVVLAGRPTEKLFPVARLLLAAEFKYDRIEGIRIAGSLGRKELVPDLAKLLDSMDSDVRTQAKKAIDSIREVQRIKNEEALKKAGLIPK